MANYDANLVGLKNTITEASKEIDRRVREILKDIDVNIVVPFCNKDEFYIHVYLNDYYWDEEIEGLVKGKGLKYFEMVEDLILEFQVIEIGEGGSSE